MIPLIPGLSSKHFFNCSPKSKPGLCQGTQPMAPLNSSLVIFPPSFAAAIAIAASGCKWSICLKGSNPCNAVSIDGALESKS